MEKSPEKYISIEYDKWINFYKPLEKINEDLKFYLKQEYRRKNITMHLGIRHYNESMQHKFVTIVPDIMLEYKQLVNLDLDLLNGELCRIINQQLQYLICRSNHTQRVSFISSDDVTHLLSEQKIILSQIEQRKTEIWDRVGKIPKWIRWLFKIN